MTNNSSSERLQGDGLAGRNGGQAASSNKMNVLMNKLIKALNVYMEVPKEKTSADASAKNNAAVNNVSAPKMSNVAAIKNSIANNSMSNNSKTNIKNNVANHIAKSNIINNTKRNNKSNNKTNSKNNTKNMTKNNAKNTTIKNNKLINVNKLKGGRRTRYNRNKSKLNH